MLRLASWERGGQPCVKPESLQLSPLAGWETTQGLSLYHVPLNPQQRGHLSLHMNSKGRDERHFTDEEAKVQKGK